MALENSIDALDHLLLDLAAADFGEATNVYRVDLEGDLAGAARIRLDNLRHYLAERRAAPVVAVGEAAGYQGMRWSGIAFTSERQLLRWGHPYRATSGRTEGWSEPSASIVHRVLDLEGVERAVVLWNAVPAHPARPDSPLSNRAPTREEVSLGASFLNRLLGLINPRAVVAIGRVAEEMLGHRATYVRHPANGGGSLFAAGMREVIDAAIPARLREVGSLRLRI